MKKLVVGTLLSMAIVVLLGSVKVASAVKGQAGSSQRSDFALFDGTNSANQPDSGAVCGARGTYTSYVAVSNFFWRGRGLHPERAPVRRRRRRDDIRGPAGGRAVLEKGGGGLGRRALEGRGDPDDLCRGLDR